MILGWICLELNNKKTKPRRFWIWFVDIKWKTRCSGNWSVLIWFINSKLDTRRFWTGSFGIDTLNVRGTRRFWNWFVWIWFIIVKKSKTRRFWNWLVWDWFVNNNSRPEDSRFDSFGFDTVDCETKTRRLWIWFVWVRFIASKLWFDSSGIDSSTVSRRPDDSGFDTLNVIEDQKILDLVRCLVCLGLDCEQ